MRAGGTSGAVLGCGGSREHILPDDLSRFHAGKDGGSKSRGAVSKGRPKDPPHVHKCFFFSCVVGSGAEAGAILLACNITAIE